MPQMLSIKFILNIHLIVAKRLNGEEIKSPYYPPEKKTTKKKHIFQKTSQ